MKYLLTLLFIISSFYSQMTAQQPRKALKPSAIFMMLHVSSNKIEALKKRGLTEDAEDVITADYEINSSIVEDFRRYFDYCPVYFFYDTMLDRLIEKKWDEVEFYDSEHFKSRKKIAISNLSNYIIAEVAFPPAPDYPVLDSSYVAGATNYPTEYANARDYGILCYDENYKILRNKLQYTNISLRRVGNVFKPSSLKYRFLGAEKFQEKLIKYY